MQVLWTYGDPWLDIRPAIAEHGTVTVASWHGRTVHQISPGWRLRQSVHRSFDGDDAAQPYEHLLGGGPCGLTFWCPWALAGAGGDHNPDELGRRIGAAVLHIKLDAPWPEPAGHPDRWCGAAHCPHLDGLSETERFARVAPATRSQTS